MPQNISHAMPDNPFAQMVIKLIDNRDDETATPRDTENWVAALATMSLAYEQHQRNRLAAITAMHRGLDLDDELSRLTEE